MQIRVRTLKSVINIKGSKIIFEIPTGVSMTESVKLPDLKFTTRRTLLRIYEKSRSLLILSIPPLRSTLSM